MNENKKIIQNGIEKIINSNQWAQYLDFFSLYCKRYSIQNSILLFSQFPNATYVAGEKQWLKKMRLVNKDAKPITLIAPDFEYYDIQLGNGQREKGKRIIGFKEIHVYDISQTTSINPEFVSTVNLADTKFVKEQAEKIYGMLKNNFTIIECSMQKDPNLDAFISYDNEKIFINKDLSVLKKVKAAVHEIGHLYLHKDTILERALREVEAETFAYICLKHLGLDTTSISIDYITQWCQTIEMERLVLRLSEMESAVKKFFKKIEKF